MTDGPFRNSELPAKWKRYGDDLVSDAASVDERVRQACDSMMHDLDMKELSPLLRELRAHVGRAQLDFDPSTAIETVFEKHPPSPITDNLQRHLIANVRDQMPKESAFDQAVASSVQDWIGTTKNRLDEECIRARDLGDMSSESYHKAMERNRETFVAIKQSDLSEALVTNNKRAFALAGQKKGGVDEGPDE